MDRQGLGIGLVLLGHGPYHANNTDIVAAVGTNDCFQKLNNRHGQIIDDHIDDARTPS